MTVLSLHCMHCKHSHLVFLLWLQAWEEVVEALDAISGHRLAICLAHQTKAIFLAHSACGCRHGRKSWKPWMLSLAVDLLSAQLSKLGATVAESEINTDSLKPGLSTSSSMLLLFSLQSFKYALHHKCTSVCLAFLHGQSTHPIGLLIAFMR